MSFAGKTIMQRLLPLLFLAGSFSIPGSATAAIVVAADDTYAQVQVNLSTNSDQHLNSGTGATAHAVFSLAHEGFTKSTFTPTLLHGSYVQTRPGTQGAHTLGYYSATFSVSANSTYLALGNYSNSDGHTTFRVHLYNNTTSSYLFENEQISDGGPANFSTNNAAGNVSNILTGSPSGYLLAGNSYSWYAFAASQASVTDFGASSLGSAFLLVEELPEPSSLLVWALVGTAVGGVWWKRPQRSRN
jgi:hypothetical protein